MLAICFFSATLLFAQGSPTLPGYDEERIEVGLLLSRGWSAPERERLGRRLPEILRRVEGKLGRTLVREFLTVLVPDQGEMVRVVEHFGGRIPGSPERVVGVALPGVRCLVVRRDLFAPSSQVEETLAHEVAHLVLHRIPSASIPRWFDEGAAMWAAGQTLDPEAEAYQSLLARLGLLYPISKLDEKFPEGEIETSRAYAQSYLLVLYLVAKFGNAAVPRLCGAFERGASAAEAIEWLSGESLQNLQRGFASWVARRRSLLLGLAAVANLWTAISLLALAAVLVGWARRIRRLREMESEEEAADVPPEEEEEEAW